MGRRRQNRLIISPGICLQGLADHRIAIEALLEFTAVCCSRKNHRVFRKLVSNVQAGEGNPSDVLYQMEYAIDQYAQQNGFWFGQNEDVPDEWGFYE